MKKKPDFKKLQEVRNLIKEADEALFNILTLDKKDRALISGKLSEAWNEVNSIIEILEQL